MSAHAIEARPVYETATPQPTDLLLAGFLAHYTGHTADAVRTDLKHYLGWLMGLGMPLLSVERPHLELYLRHLEMWTSTRTHGGVTDGQGSTSPGTAEQGRRHAVTERGGPSLVDTSGTRVNPRKPLTTHAQTQQQPRHPSGASVSPEVAR